MKRILIIILSTLLIISLGCSSKKLSDYIEDLKSENIMVRENAIYNLGVAKEKRAAPLLIQLLKEDQPKALKFGSIAALGKIGDTGENSNVDALIDVLQERDVELVIAAVEALGKIKNSRAVNPLLNALENENLSVRFTAILALGSIGDERAVTRLTQLVDDPDKYVSYNAKQALKRIGVGK